MADVLDQSQVDALLAAVDTGDVAEEAGNELIFSRSRRADDPVEIRSYDFKRPERVSKDQMLALQTLHEAFARNFGASLSGFLRTIVEVKVATCEQMTYAEFIAGLANPTSFNLITADTLEGTICLEISPLIIYPIIDRLLGGSSQDLFIPQRPMTLIESRLISNVTERGLIALSEAWSTVKSLKFTVSATESNPQLVQIVPPNEVVVVIGFELKLANRAGTMNLCIPYNVIEPVMDHLSAQSWFSTARHAKSNDNERRISSTLHAASLQVAGCLATTTISLADLLSMSVGDVIVTEKPSQDPVVVTVEGEAKFLAHMGKHKEKLALRVLRPITQADRVS
ncbi:MAG: flagellar motor switch protein FliM [Phycisphaeraceae bacterium]|nr:flagellar motor switch protein FliM [Phycisphaeraceae bacterium]QYK48767.1 MAG: flagellar motor switch protein FliM [Phycisphaeraceae bacterium]